MSSSTGQKVTNDPRSDNPINESVGTVTSDSLAAQSTAFQEGNPNSAPMKQTSKGTTTNNTDTSGATVLNSAANAEAREAQQGWDESAQFNAGSNLGKEAGVGPTYNTAAGGGSSGGSSHNTGAGGIPGNASTAPAGSYAGSAELAQNPGVLKPKGKNITEGGFEGNEPNASGNQNIGSEEDPGRVAEQNFQLRDTQSANDAAGGARQKGTASEGAGVYEALSSDQQA